MRRQTLDRRRFLAATAITTTALAAPFVRGAHAAGKLSLGLWDHWVPGANAAASSVINEWAAKERVEVTIDYIPSQGNKNLLTIAAEAQARSGHDILAMPTWWPHAHASQLEPVNDIMGPLMQQNGKVNGTVEYLGKLGDKWLGVPATIGSQIKGPVSRLDLMKQHAGLDMQAMYPAGAAPKADAWNMDAYAKAAEACHKAGVPFGVGLGETTDSVDTAGAFFLAFGASLVDAKGELTVKTDAVREALTYLARVGKFYPADAPAWDDASNNRWIVSGRGAMIMNPPSSWAVAKRDAPQVAQQLWHHGFPQGPKGRFSPFLPYFWTIWDFSRNKSAAKSVLVHMSSRAAAEKFVEASAGYDIPSFDNFLTFKTWQDADPPKGTLYHYPNPHNHQTLSIAASPAPPKIAQQIYAQGTLTKMIVRHMQGEALERTLSWAESEVEGFLRG
ncbi:ABC transporter substrate-binding protein [Phreatobacter oligotrophus]|uniref:ABC transporter substrate-binding protein n=1 Tax=Phreatobacter oligotrophus TaxID=1122261 RepID=UPI002352E5C6|nr:extracellular solute-binding protein [Phreatobacter oligotrophus]MBX9991153.1 extracellular solute-binding protein [Phreatobacter oligotrophus]